MAKDGCVYDAELFPRSHGFETLDLVGREAFVNHIHVSGDDRERQADEIIAAWSANMSSNWPTRIFRIYRDIVDDEIIVRFHMVRPGVVNWSDGNDCKVIVVRKDSE
jgi:hypothetical protein